MPRYDDPDHPYYFGEVIGSAMSYHLPTCHIIPLIRRRNYKRLRDWKEAVSLGLSPCPHCRPPYAELNDRSQESPLTARELGDLRRGLMKVLEALEAELDSPNSKSSIAARIDRLQAAKVIPREVAFCMRIVTEMRNAAEYEDKASQARTSAVEGALSVIREWAEERGVALPEALKRIAPQG